MVSEEELQAIEEAVKTVTREWPDAVGVLDPDPLMCEFYRKTFQKLFFARGPGTESEAQADLDAAFAAAARGRLITLLTEIRRLRAGLDLIAGTHGAECANPRWYARMVLEGKRP
jgi:hypothetical protein